MGFLSRLSTSKGRRRKEGRASRAASERECGREMAGEGKRDARRGKQNTEQCLPPSRWIRSIEFVILRGLIENGIRSFIHPCSQSVSRTSGQTDRQKAGRTGERTNRRTDGRTNRRTDEPSNRRTDSRQRSRLLLLFALVLNQIR